MELLDSPIVQLAALKQVESIKAAIFDNYGFEPSDEYCHDLIMFVEALGPSEEAIDEP